MRIASKKNATRAVVGLGAALALTACNGSFTGFGFMPSRGLTTGMGATVNFRVVCDQDTDQVSGHVSYRDGRNRVAFGAAPSQVGIVSTPFGPQSADCDGDVSQGHYVGPYTPSNPALAGGQLTFDLLAHSANCRNRAEVWISLSGGAYDLYSNHQCMTLGSVRPIL